VPSQEPETAGHHPAEKLGTSVKNLPQQPAACPIFLTVDHIRNLISGYIGFAGWRAIACNARSAIERRNAFSVVATSYSTFVLGSDDEYGTEIKLDYARLGSIVEMLASPTLVLGPDAGSTTTREESIRDQKRLLKLIAMLANERQGGPVISSLLDKILAGFDSQN
jgi:hypothetical protein